MSEKKEKIRTLFVSDIHMGLSFSKVEKFYKVVEHYDVENIYFIGDTLNSVKYQSQKQQLLQTLINKTNSKTKLYFLRGNHDSEMNYNGSFFKEILYTTLQNKRYLLSHGDIFDQKHSENRFILMVGEVVYFIALILNDISAFFSRKKPFLFTKFIKDHNKLISSHLKKFKQFMVHYAQKREVDGIICGHIHYPSDEKIESIHYLNCGDWIENYSFVIETTKGELKLLTYYDISYA